MTWRRTSVFTDTLELAQVKEYLKVNYTDEDQILDTLLAASLSMVEKIVQKAIFNTSYTDFWDTSTSVVPQYITIADTDPPLAKPSIFYTNTSSVRTQYPPNDIEYTYSLVTRAIDIELTGSLPEMSTNTVEGDWSVAGNSTDLVNSARLRLIAGWYENREALTGNYSWVNGVEALLSPISLVV